MEFQKNDIVTVSIEDMGSEGEGIGRTDGFTLFVKDAVAGDIVEAKILKCKKNYAYARLEKVLTPSPFRVEPVCACHRQCGGCQLQALSYEKQLQFKQEKIRNNLIRIGGFEETAVDKCMEPVIGMEEPYHYRNKAQYPVGTDREGNPVAGFYAGRTHSIISNTDCALGAPENQEILEIILKYMKQYGVSAYDEAAGAGLVRHILIRKGFASGEIMVCLIINLKMTDMSYKKPAAKSRHDKFDEGNTSCQCFLPRQEELLSRLASVKGMTSVSVSVNTERTNVIMGKEIHTIWGRDTISDTIRVRDMRKPGFPFTGEELHFHISPLSFYQVNPVQTEKLYSLALEYAGLTGQETVWDLYCGIGTISLFLAGKAKRVYGVEIIPQAVEDARKNAERNGIANAEFFVGKAEEVLPGFYENRTCENVAREDAYADKAGRDKDCVENGGGSRACETKAYERDIDFQVSDKTIRRAAGNGLEVVGGRRSKGASEESSEVANRGANWICGTVSAAGAGGEHTKGASVESTEEAAGIKPEPDMLCPDVIVVDPPRKGCDKACLSTILKMRPDRIVYVSCDSATLARDLRILCDGGYELKRVRGMDQFGMTVHVETVVMLSHKKPDSVINVKVEFGEGEGKVPLDNIVKRAAAYKPKERVTYKMIKEYIEAKYGFKVHTAYIAEVKRDLGLPMYDAPNAIEKLKQPRKHPTAEKVEAIKDALKHFEVI